MERDREILDIRHSEEFAEYKRGFVNGKNDILNLLLNDIDYYEGIDENEDYDWYNLGYDDAYTYYDYLLIENEHDVDFNELLGEMSWTVLNEFYFQRIAEYNQNNNSEAVALTLKLAPPKRYNRWKDVNG